ncbi:MAG: hypothetical protein Q8O67_06240 [Deltaproteobacteria bacterium]|nr:hypothetical protein [Deltaproteobacteria bacterium]
MKLLVLAFVGGTLACSAPTQEADPVYAASAASGVSSSDIDRWDTAEAEPLFAASAASEIQSEDITRWDAAITSEADPAFNGSPAAAIVDDDIARWNAAAVESPKHLNVNATEFISRLADPNLDYLAGQGIRFGGGSGGATLLAAVHLPDGARVTALSCFLRDNDVTQEVIDGSRAQLSAGGLPDYGTSFEVLAEVPLVTTGQNDVVTHTAPAFGMNTVVNNAANQYILSAGIQLSGADGDFFDPLFRGCTISYTAR